MNIKQLAKDAGFYFHTIPEYSPTQHTLPREYSEKCFIRFAQAIRDSVLEEDNPYKKAIEELSDFGYDGDYKKHLLARGESLS